MESIVCCNIYNTMVSGSDPSAAAFCLFSYVMSRAMTSITVLGLTAVESNFHQDEQLTMRLHVRC